MPASKIDFATYSVHADNTFVHKVQLQQIVFISSGQL